MPPGTIRTYTNPDSPESRSVNQIGLARIRLLDVHVVNVVPAASAERQCNRVPLNAGSVAFAIVAESARRYHPAITGARLRSSRSARLEVWGRGFECLIGRPTAAPYVDRQVDEDDGHQPHDP
jgi:hypothetical protein